MFSQCLYEDTQSSFSHASSRFSKKQGFLAKVFCLFGGWGVLRKGGGGVGRSILA